MQLYESSNRGLEHLERKIHAQIVIHSSLCLSFVNGRSCPNFRLARRAGGFRNFRLRTRRRYNASRCSGRRHDHPDRAFCMFECSPLTQPWILPKFAAVGRCLSEIVILYTSAVPLTVRVDLFKQDGTPLTTSLSGQSGSSFQNLVIPAEGILVENNDDNGALQAGYAIVTPLDTIAPTVTSTVPAN